MNCARRIIHALLFAAVLFGIICAVLFLLRKNLWYSDALALSIAFAIGFFSGTFDKKAEKPYNLVAEDPEEVDDGLDE